MESVSKAVRDNFNCLILAVQCDMIDLPATKRRVDVMAALSRIEAGIKDLEAALKP